MFRKLVLPLAAAALLAGCVTSAPYGYRGGDRGDYYYGRPSVDYRHAYPGYGYGYPGGGYYGPYRSGISIHGRYGYPGGFYGYPGGYYGHPYYGHPYYGNPYYGYPRPIYRRPARPGGGDQLDGSPWRNIDEIRRRRQAGTPGGDGPSPSLPQPTVTGPRISEPRVMRPRSDDGGSAMGGMVRRAREGIRPSSDTDE